MFHDRRMAALARRLAEPVPPRAPVAPAPVAELLARVEAALAAGSTRRG